MDSNGGEHRLRGGRLDVWLYLVPLGFIFDLAGYVPVPLRVWLTWALLALPLCRRPGTVALKDGAGLMLALAVKAYAPLLPPVADRLLLLAAHQWVWRGSPSVPPYITKGLLFFTALHLFLFDAPSGYGVTETLAGFGNAVAAALTGRTFNLGPTYQGLGAWLLPLCLSLFAWRRDDRIAPVRTVAFAGVGLLLMTLLGDVMLSKIPFAVNLTWELTYREPFGIRQLIGRLPDLAVLAMPLAYYVAALILYGFLHVGAWQSAQAAPGAAGTASVGIRRAMTWCWPAPVIWLALIAVATPPTAWRRPQAREVVFVERGIVSYSKPNDTRFGRGAAGMFGMLPEYTRLFGCGATVTPDVPAELDPDRHILLFTNLNAPMPDAEHRRIWEFVAAGGGLWVIGDHTFIKDGRHHINDLLAPCDIKLENDSVFFFPQGWFHSYRFPQGTPFGLLTEDADNRPGFLVGASLIVRGPARPFMFGRFAYGDLGLDVPDERGSYMGDAAFQRDERLGDFVLVAGQRYGRGRVLVYGDTTSFFNHMLPGSYELLRASLSWFGERPAWPAAVARAAALLLLAALAVTLVIGRAAPSGVVFCVAGLLFSALIHRPTGQLPWDREFARRHAAIVDFTHHPEASRHGNMPTGLNGVSLSLMRRGLLPIEPPTWQPDVLDATACIVFNAPRRPFSAAARRALNRYMEEGGTVILACGFPHYEVSRPLLEPLGLRVRGVPLGRFFDRQAFGGRISFFNAWPIEISPASDATVLCAYDDAQPLIVAAPVGRGRLVLIADSEFLQNRNLESSDRHDPANVRFVRELFERISSGEPWP